MIKRTQLIDYIDIDDIFIYLGNKNLGKKIPKIRKLFIKIE